MTTAKGEPYSSKLADLSFFAIDRALDSVMSRRPLIPFVIQEDGGGRHLTHFAQETFEAGVNSATRHARSSLKVSDRVALAFDGFVSRDGGKVSAVLVRAQDRVDNRSHVLAQPYDSATDPARALGNVLYLGQEASF